MIEPMEREPLRNPASNPHFKVPPMKVSIEPVEQFKWALEGKSHCLHRLLWAAIMLGSTCLAIYSSTSIYLSWQAAPVLGPIL